MKVIFEIQELLNYDYQENSEKPLSIEVDNSTLGNINRLLAFNEELDSKFNFSKKFIALANSLNFKEKIFLVDVINSFKYKSFRYTNEGMAWYNTRLLNIKEENALIKLKDHRLLITPDLISTKFFSVSEIIQIANNNNIDIKKSWSRKKIIQELYSLLDIELLKGYIEEKTVVQINDEYKTDITLLIQRLYKTRAKAIQIIEWYLSKK